ncbi:unnamed protein product, partial [Vitis vinifera]
MASTSETIGGFFEKVCGSNSKKSKDREDESQKIEGRVVLMKKNVMDLNDSKASLIDSVYELVGKHVSLQLISATHADPENNLGGKIGKATCLQKWNCTGPAITARETEFAVTFDWEEGMGVPGALRVSNHHHSEFYLSSVTLEDVPGQGRIHFVCNSWVFPVRYTNERVFFSNKAYLPCHTPEPLRQYREEELVKLRGNGQGERKTWERIYDYDVYNDLGNPDKGPSHARPILGGSEDYPYPRRGRTGRERTKTDPCSEKRLSLLRLDIYVPRDERFSQVKFSDVLAYAVKSLVQVLIPEIRSLFDKTVNEFDSFQDVLNIYEVGINGQNGGTHGTVRDCISWEFIRELAHSDVGFHKFPMPDVIKENTTAWRTDEEFGREMLAGVNPVIIRRLEEFPPVSKLDINKYGNQTSTITKEHIEKNMNGLTVDQAIKNDKLFILDYHDALMPFLSRINSTSTKTYATRTLLFLKEDGTLKPLAIELSLPHPQGESYGATSQVYTPAEDGVEGSVWQLAKAYAAVNDSGYHQLISHWLNTHAVIEPFVIATNRQLSVLHPIYKLLHPHFRDTMNINALARHILINAGGFLEMTVFPGKYALEMSAVIYKNWNFTEQGLPADLLKRGVAVEDPNYRHGLRLLIEDYPYAVDGLEVWSAIETWLERNPDLAFLKTITAQLQTLLGVSLIEILSRHSTDEIYLGQRDTPEWTSDAEPLAAFERFGSRLRGIETRINQMNQDRRWNNRFGPGIPNSVSI